MPVKTWINDQLYKFQQIFYFWSPINQTIIISLLIYDYISWRSISPYIAIPLIIVLLFSIFFTIAHIYTDRLEMYKHKRFIEAVKRNPYQKYAFTPFETMVWKTFHLPSIKAHYHTLILTRTIIQQSKGNETNLKEVDSFIIELKEFIDNVEEWIEKNYITKKGYKKYAPNLLKYYTEEEGVIK